MSRDALTGRLSLADEAARNLGPDCKPRRSSSGWLLLASLALLAACVAWVLL